jgi:hypothetical protein
MSRVINSARAVALFAVLVGLDMQLDAGKEILSYPLGAKQTMDTSTCLACGSRVSRMSTGVPDIFMEGVDSLGLCM